MFKEVLGDWPLYDKLILVSCDEVYFNSYFPRFYKTFTDFWDLPIHAHVIDPSIESLQKLKNLKISHTWCNTTQHDWVSEVTKYKDSIKGLQNPNDQVRQWLYECYCQCQRFVLLGENMSANQSVIVADVDAYAQNELTTNDKDYIFDKTCFSTHNQRLMATLCHFHPRDINAVKQMGDLIVKQLTDTFVLGMDQLAIKKMFGKNNELNILGQRWIRHLDVKTPRHLQEHLSCLVYHEKGTRGKGKGIQVQWAEVNG